ncbi:unnamed protein product, partial [Rotaria magnacalcarata]
MANTAIDELCPLVFHPKHIPTKIDNRTKTQKALSVWFILITVGFERLAFYSLAGNLVLFLTSDSIRWTSFNSITASLIFYGTSYISAVVFSWISDAKLGRAKTIIIGFCLYLVGYLFIPLFSKVEIFEKLCGTLPAYMEESTSYSKETCSGLITAALVISAIGVGAVQANMAIFGAEQIQEEKFTTRYFYKYYIAVNTGCFLAFGIIAYVQQNKSYFIGYVISTILLAVTFVIFVAGYRCYIHIKPYDSVITNFFPILINAFQTKWKHQRCAREKLNKRRALKQSIYSSDDENENHDDSVSDTDEQQISFFDYAKADHDGRYSDRIVDDVKSLRPIIAMFLLLIPYWLIYVQ